MQQAHGTQKKRTRRGFLNTAAVVGAGVAARSVADVIGSGHADAAGPLTEDAATILNAATTAETVAVTFYYTALMAATFHIDEASVACLALMMDAEMEHLHTLRSLGGVALQQRVHLPERMLSDAHVFVHTGLTVERACASLYLAATGQLAALGQPRLAADTARHAARHAQHLTLIGHLAGLPAHDLTMAAPAFDHVSNALRALAPFLAGGTGFTGPISVPSGRQYQAARDAITAGRRPSVATT